VERVWGMGGWVGFVRSWLCRGGKGGGEEEELGELGVWCGLRKGKGGENGKKRKGKGSFDRRSKNERERGGKEGRRGAEEVQQGVFFVNTRLSWAPFQTSSRAEWSAVIAPGSAVADTVHMSNPTRNPGRDYTAAERVVAIK